MQCVSVYVWIPVHARKAKNCVVASVQSTDSEAKECAKPIVEK